MKTQRGSISSLLIATLVLVACAHGGGAGGSAGNAEKNQEGTTDFRRDIDCAGIYKQTQWNLTAKLERIGKYSAEAGLGHDQLVKLNEHAAIIGMRHRELCEVFKKTKEFTIEQYLRRSAELDQFDLELSRILELAVKAQTDAQAVRDGDSTSDAAKSLGELGAACNSFVERISEFDENWATSIK